MCCMKIQRCDHSIHDADRTSRKIKLLSRSSGVLAPLDRFYRVLKPTTALNILYFPPGKIAFRKVNVCGSIVFYLIYDKKTYINILSQAKPKIQKYI